MSAPRRLVLRPLMALARAQCGGGAGAGPGSAATAAAAAARATAATATAAARTAAASSSSSSSSSWAAARALAQNPLNNVPLAARPLMMMMATTATTRSPALTLRGRASPSLPPRGRRALQTSSARAAAAAEAQQPTPPKNETPWGQKSPLSFNSMVAGLAVFLGVVALAQGTADKRVGDMMAKSQQVAGKAAVGGPFRLIESTKNKPFTNRDLLGEFALLYFGFTHCPDICPDELEKVAEAVDAVEQTTGAKVVPVFISVDPKRDTPQRVAAYVREFHPRMLGLTGSDAAVTDAAKAYRVYFATTPGGGDEDYLVDHSIITYLIDPKGEFVTFYGKNFDSKQLAESIGGHVMAWAEKDDKYLAGLACPMPKKDGDGGGGGGKK